MCAQFQGFVFYPQRWWAAGPALPSSYLPVAGTNMGNIAFQNLYEACASRTECASFTTTGTFRYSTLMATAANVMNWINVPDALSGDACAGSYVREAGNVGFVTRECADG